MSESKVEGDAFLAECEAIANETNVFATKAAQGPWLSNVMHSQGRYCGTGPSRHYTATDNSMAHAACNAARIDAEFIAHARTSNPDLAARVLALVKMVRERDETIAVVVASAREFKADYVHVINAQDAELKALRKGIGQPPIEARNVPDDFEPLLATPTVTPKVMGLDETS
jgi:hypothetical protein